MHISALASNQPIGINSLEIDSKNDNKTFYASFLSRLCISTCSVAPPWFCDDRMVHVTSLLQPDPTRLSNPPEGGRVKRAYKWQEVSSNIYCSTALIIWHTTLFTSSVSSRAHPVVRDGMRRVPVAIRFLFAHTHWHTWRTFPVASDVHSRMSSLKFPGYPHHSVYLKISKGGYPQGSVINASIY